MDQDNQGERCEICGKPKTDWDKHAPTYSCNTRCNWLVPDEILYLRDNKITLKFRQAFLDAMKQKYDIMKLIMPKKKYKHSAEPYDTFKAKWAETITLKWDEEVKLKKYSEDKVPKYELFMQTRIKDWKKINNRMYKIIHDSRDGKE